MQPDFLAPNFSKNSIIKKYYNGVFWAQNFKERLKACNFFTVF